MIDETNCDLVMIGRAAIGNPLIFAEINHFLKTGKKKVLNDDEKKKAKLDAFFDYVKFSEAHGIISIQKMKTQALWFTKGIYGSAKLREKMSQIRTIEEIKKEMKEFLKSG